MREVGYPYPRLSNIQPPQVMSGPGIGAQQVLPQPVLTQPFLMQPLVPQPLLPQSPGGGPCINTSGGSETEEEPSEPLGSLLERIGCIDCGQIGHTKEQCTQGCRKCGSIGHRAEACVSGNVCPCAEFPGHIRRNCPLPCFWCMDKRHYDEHRAIKCKRRCAVCGSWQHPTDDCRLQCDCA